MFGEATESEYIPSLRHLLGIVWKRLWVILLTTIVLTGAAVGFSLVQTPVYAASIEILVGQEENTVNPNNLGGDVTGLQQLTRTLAEAINSRPVSEEVIRQLDLRVTPEDFLENLSVQQIAETQFIEVRYEDPSPEKAQQVANTVGDVFTEQVSGISPSASGVTATVWERAALPTEAASPNLMLNILLALVLGGILGVCLAFLLEHLDDSWRTPEEAEQISGVPTFGIIPEFEISKSKKERR
jgi:capsular polysaccharide biosynthesis protein